MLRRTFLQTSRAARSSSPLLRPSTAFRQPLLARPLQRIQPLSVSSRWQSEATAEAGKQQGEAASQTNDKASESKDEASAADASKKQLEAKDKEIAELKDKYLRSVADFRNLQDRTKREVTAAREFGISAFAKELLDSVDNLDRALSTVTPQQLEPSSTTAAKDLSALHGGLKMTEQILMAALKKHGLERYDPTETGEKFDANAHEATFMAPQEGKEDGTVFYTQSKGFRLNGRTLRAAKVGVVKNS